MTRAKSFREAMKRGMVAAPGCYDCITARSIERAQLKAEIPSGNSETNGATHWTKMNGITPSIVETACRLSKNGAEMK